ncbi:Serine phosphatase RsbU, regulator of sigma subunit [Lishizhenia tianjinensis]|uniref:Serine phosphatase RsbU, regulator of sigma subunit n=1 Tax=Lishizhenia tianjinensis TaxID=477690 RepID=A0A1I6YHQ2_9FLAO|nr:SpoIIE family protein phosphatase [Lishizhenia tianjinensis]SFT49912.1 Serine phosphatase RsbU, regulator of sigma subunit [Lishizhenia tianjinensis]
MNKALLVTLCFLAFNLLTPFRSQSIQKDLSVVDTGDFIHFKNLFLKQIHDPNNTDSLIIESYIRLASLYAKNLMVDKSLKIFDTIQLKFDFPNIAHKTHVLKKKSEIFREAESYDIAIQAEFQALKYFEVQGDLPNICRTYIDIVKLFLLTKDINNSTYYLSQVSEIARKNNLLSFQAEAYQLLGDIYKSNNELTQAETSYKKAIEIAEQCNCSRSLSATYNNLANLYRLKERFLLANQYIDKAISINTETNQYNWLAINHLTKGNLEENLGSRNKAILYYEKFIRLVDSLELEVSPLNGYFNLYKTYSHIEDYENAINYLENYLKLKDSIYQLESEETSAKLAAQYQSSRKEAEIERFKIQEQLREEELNSEKNSKRVLILFISIILVVTVSLWVSSLQRKKINKDLTLKNERIDEQHKEIIDSINYAKRIQNSILPSTQLLNNTLPNNALLYLPKDIVSGDFYICEKIGNYVYFGVADCTGHGVPGAMVSLVASSVLNKCLHELRLTNTNDILDHLNIEVPQVLASDNEEIHDGMDIALCRLDVNTLQLQFSGAYLNCWVFNETSFFMNRIPDDMNFSGRNGLNILEIKGNRKGIGKSNVSSKFKVVDFQLQKGDKIMLSSDGFEDQFGGPKNKKFKLNQMRNLVFTYGSKSVDVLLQELSTSFQTWKGNNEQVDDVCLMIIEI